MSLFLGKDANNAAVLHITSGVESPDSMKQGIMPTTVFHSASPFVHVTATHTLTKVSSISGTAFTLNQSDADRIGANSIAFILVIDDELRFDQPVQIYNDANFIWTNDAQDATSVTPSSTFNTLIFTNYNFNSVILNELNVVNGIVNDFPNDGSGILVTPGKLLVNGYDISTIKYLSLDVINSVDPTGFSAGQTLQLVNTVNNSGSISIRSNINSSNIFCGNYPIFSTSAKKFSGISMPYSSSPFGGNYPTSTAVNTYSNGIAAIGLGPVSSSGTNIVAIDLSNTAETTLLRVLIGQPGTDVYNLTITAQATNGVVTFNMQYNSDVDNPIPTFQAHVIVFS